MSTSDSEASRTAHILVVDDEEKVAALIAGTLRGAGYGVDVCHDGAGAVRYVQEHDVDLVLLDLLLQDSDGFAVAQEMKRLFGSDRFVPIVIVSGLNDDKNKTSGLAHADDYMSKPFSNEELLARVRAMLRIRLLQHELLQSRNRYRLLYQNIPEMYVSLDAQRRVWDCNNSFCQTYGLSKDGVVGKSVYDLFEAQGREAMAQYFASLEQGRATSSPQIFQMRSARRGEMPVRVGVRGVRLGADPDGPTVVLVMHDVTETLQLEEEQRIARRQLYRSAQMVSIGTLASGVAHELNNPLAAILGFADALLYRLENEETIQQAELQQYLGIIKSESLRCRDIIDNLLRFSRDREPEIRDVSLLDCIQSACSLIGPRAAKKHIVIKNTLESDVAIRADPQRISQVFLNVLANAVDFSPEGASVTIALSADEPSARHVTVRIDDTGPGIAPDALPRIFDPFFTTKEVGKGMGVGLAICHKAMEECEGSIDVVSGQGKGTSVLLQMPRGGALK